MSQQYISDAKAILDLAGDLANNILNGATTFDTAYKTATDRKKAAAKRAKIVNVLIIGTLTRDSRSHAATARANQRFASTPLTGRITSATEEYSQALNLPRQYAPAGQPQQPAGPVHGFHHHSIRRVTLCGCRRGPSG